MFKSVRNTVLSFALLTGLAPVAGMAQTTPQQKQATDVDYGQEELKAFVEATQAVQTVQQQYQMKMVSSIKEEGLDPMKFQQMAQAQQQESSEMEMTAEEKKAFEAAMQSVMEIQKNMNAEMQTTLAEHDMEVQEYQSMAMNIRQNPEMSKKVQQMMQQ